MKLRRNPAARLTPLHPENNPLGDPLHAKSIKNEGRSGNVYENKGSMDKMPEKISDICARPKAFLQKFPVFEGQFAGNCTFETYFVCLPTARACSQSSAPPLLKSGEGSTHLAPGAIPPAANLPPGSPCRLAISKMKVHPAICMKIQGNDKKSSSIRRSFCQKRRVLTTRDSGLLIIYRMAHGETRRVTVARAAARPTPSFRHRCPPQIAEAV
jgi:hypothetical protein